MFNFDETGLYGGRVGRERKTGELFPEREQSNSAKSLALINSIKVKVKAYKVVTC
jgi:hypothetical protein